MVKLTLNVAARGIGKQSKNSSCEDYLKKVTHLYLQGKCIDSIGNISMCEGLTVLYLHDNCIVRIENLQHAKNLTHLYLQKNQIAKIENLGSLKKLSKLYLGQNCITVVENLEGLENLEELHLEKQRIPRGECLYFDPRTMDALAHCLATLNVSGNGMLSLVDINKLASLEHLSAEDNALKDLDEVAQTLQWLTVLSRLDLDGNPIATSPKYRERVIASCAKLDFLDGKEVTDLTRSFLQKLEISKNARQQTMNDLKFRRKSSSESIPPSLPLSKQNPFIVSSVPEVPMYPPWKIRTSKNFTNKERYGNLPRPFWQFACNTDRQRPKQGPKEQGFSISVISDTSVKQN